MTTASMPVRVAASYANGALVSPPGKRATMSTRWRFTKPPVAEASALRSRVTRTSICGGRGSASSGSPATDAPAESADAADAADVDVDGDGDSSGEVGASATVVSEMRGPMRAGEPSNK
jgi:hypothetical protein